LPCCACANATARAAKIINPEDNDIAALAVGSIAPCLSAPWWEEVLYRGFMLPALTLYLPRSVAVPASAVLFAVRFL
jgi:membrane protease YdiL (CAAX protease family)